MTQDDIPDEKSNDDKPLTARQREFARELGIAWARGQRNYVDIYEKCGYKPDRGNATRLAQNPKVRAIAEEACAQANRLNGLYVGYLQAKALQMLDANALAIHRRIAASLKSGELTPDQEAELDAATWPLSKFKIDKDGLITIELPDKKGLIEMLARMLGTLSDPTAEAITGLGDRLDRAIQRVSGQQE